MTRRRVIAAQRCAVAFTAAASLACGAPARDHASSRADTREAITPAPFAGTPASTAPPAGSRSGASSSAAPAAAARVAAWAICDSVASLWRSIAGTQVSRADSAAVMLSTTTPVPACHVLMVAAAGLPSESWALGNWADSTRGWRESLHWFADGPDGFNKTFIRGAVRCQIRYEHDGGDDSDSTYVPNPRATEQTSCWADPIGITARDTVP